MKKNKFDNYFNLLVYKNSPIAKDVQKEMFSFLFDKFVQYNKDLLMLNDGYITRLTSRVAFETMSFFELEMKFPNEDIKTYDEEKARYRWNIKIKEVYDTITSLNQFQLLRYTSDLFSLNQEVIKDDVKSEITVIGNKLNIKVVETNIKENEYKEIVSDYKKHFKYFDDLLSLIVDMRFAKDRKASFLHLRVKSDWGKSFLSGLLKNINIAFEVDYHNLMNKGANDIAPIQVRNSFVLIIDEFNNFSSEMKKLSHSFSFAPKFGMREDVELFLKILLSAEKSPSFSGGVDDQIVNRVMVMEIADSEAFKLVDRAIYKKYGNAKYMEALERYTYLILSSKVKNYLDMEKFEAHKKADITVREYVKKFKMKDISVLNDSVRDVVIEGIKEILDSIPMELNPKLKDIAGNIIEIKSGKYMNNFFIKQPQRTFETIVKAKVSEQELKKMKYKLSNYEDITYLIRDYSKDGLRVKGNNTKGVVISLKDIKKIDKPIKEEIIREQIKSIEELLRDKTRHHLYDMNEEKNRLERLKSEVSDYLLNP